MRDKSVNADENNKLNEDKVPKIRLKLKAPSSSASASAGVNEAGITSANITSNSASTSVNHSVKLFDTTDTNDTNDTNYTGKFIDTNDNLQSSPNSARSISSARSIRSVNSTSSSSFHGTFKYRPFKLFPLLPPTSRYRVLIPSKYTNHRNPAIKLNYLWKLPGSTGVYTDDSDLVCVLIREGWIKNFEDVKVMGKDLLVEVEVVESNDLEVKDQVNNEEVKNVVKDQVNNAVNTGVNIRSYEGHDGHYIRIINCTVDPSAVHLKHWRKPKHPPKSDPIVTPKFKTKTQS